MIQLVHKWNTAEWEHGSKVLIVVYVVYKNIFLETRRKYSFSVV